MSTDNPNSPGSLPENGGFATVDTILATNESLGDILSCILQHEESGAPLVIRGLNADPKWSPLPIPPPLEDQGFAEPRSPGR